MKNWYLTYVIKKPYLYFCFILMGITVILGLLFTTTVPIVNTYPVRLVNNQEEYILLCDEPIFNLDINSIFIYADKNEAMYQLSNYAIINENGIIINGEISELLSQNNSNNFYIDVSKYTVTLFEEIFVQGGKN